jgi:hypothetical protein
MSAPQPSKLLGMPLSIVRHASTMLGLHFGVIRRGERESWGELALHIDCPWRMLKDGQIFVGKQDHWNPIIPILDWEAWWKDPYPNLEDAAWLKLLGKKDEITDSYEVSNVPLIVQDVRISPVGDLSLIFSEGYNLETFSCGTKDEFWRLLEPGKETEHFVVKSLNID